MLSDSEEGETALVPGKVLGYGEINHPVNVAALNYSAEAEEKLEKSGSETIDIEELIKETPDKEKMKIIK